jgi:hypothetical protein
MLRVYVNNSPSEWAAIASNIGCAAQSLHATLHCVAAVFAAMNC